MAHGGLRWLNALHPDVGELLTRLLAEVVERYAVDGVQGDDHIAVPRGGSHDPATLARYWRLTGRTPAATHDDRAWRHFRTHTLSHWVRQTAERLHALRPGLRWCLSPAPWPTGLRELSQDSAAWLAEGSVDLLLPQLYRHSFAAYRQLLRANLRLLPSERRRQVVAGLTLRANGRTLPAETLRRMVRLSRQEGLGGVAVFHLTPLLAGETPLALAPGDRLAGCEGCPAPSPLP